MNQTRLLKSTRRIAVLLCALCACLLTSAAVDITAEFTDENFRNAVRETLQKGAGDPTGFSGAWDTGNYFFTPQRTPDGAGSIASSGLRVFPGDGGLWLTGLVPGERLTVYTMLGQPVFAGAVSAAEWFLPLSARGAYIIYYGGYGLKAVY